MSAQKLYPTDPIPVMSVRRISPTITTISLPFARFGRMRIGARSTLIKLPSGSVAVFAPVAPTPSVKSAITDMGGTSVKYIIAPDIEHHIYLGPWHKEYPDAKVIASEGLPDKRKAMGGEYAGTRFDVLTKAKSFKKEGSDEMINHTIGGKFGVDDEFDREFDTCYVASHANKELVFNYKRERTMVEADLIFNLPAVEQYSNSSENPHAGFWTKFFNGFQGTTGNASKWQQRFVWYMGSSPDREAFNRSVSVIDGWDFDRIIPCHGDVIETGGKGVFRQIMAWHLKSKQ